MLAWGPAQDLSSPPHDVRLALSGRCGGQITQTRIGTKSRAARSQNSISLPLTEDDRRRVRRSLWGITFVGLGLGLSVVGLLLGSGGSLASGGPFWCVFGFAFLVASPEFFGKRHRLSVLLAVGVGMAALVAYSLMAFPGSSLGPADLLRAQLGASTLFVVLGCLATYLALYGMLDRREGWIATVGLLSAIVVQVYILYLVTIAIGGATGSTDTARGLWMQLGRLNAVPLGLLLAACEVAYWRLRRRYLPGASVFEA